MNVRFIFAEMWEAKLWRFKSSYPYISANNGVIHVFFNLQSWGHFILWAVEKCTNTLSWSNLVISNVANIKDMANNNFVKLDTSFWEKYIYISGQTLDTSLVCYVS